MVEPLTIGSAASRRIVLDESRMISFMGEDLRVYATPEIVWDAEMLCRDLFLEHLEKGNDSVGVRLELDHVAAGMPGSEIEIGVRVREISGRRVTFDFVVRDAIETLASGCHQRVAVSLPATLERIAAKRERLEAARADTMNATAPD